MTGNLPRQVSRYHLKCGLMRGHWTSGYGSDIRAKWPACLYYEQSNEGTEKRNPPCQ